MIPGFIIMALAKAGALLQNNIFIYVMIAGICIVIGLVAFNKLKEPYYPHLIVSIGLALLLQSSLLGPGLIGSDIHTEYYFYYKALDGWDASFSNPYNTVIGTTLIAPFLTNVFHIPGYWIYKAVFPLVGAFIPFILYFVFRKEFGSKTAFFAAIFFVMVPTWSMEMIALPKQILGELMFVTCLFLILVSKWRLKIRIPLLVALGSLGAMFHYVMGPVILFFLGLCCLFLLFFKRRAFPVKWLGLVVVLLLIISVAFYGLVAQGISLKCITGVSTGYITNYGLESGDEEGYVVEFEGGQGKELIVGAEDANMPRFLANLSPLMRTAWGLDFMDVDIWGKIFRILQYLTQILIVVGVICLIKERKRYSAEYLSLCAASVLLLGASMFIPRFATVINATRMYHIALIILAPAFILGGKALLKNFKLLTVFLIIPYFLFTSGLIFEATQQTDISQVNMPYSISLSNNRVDMVGVFTENDMVVRDWLVDNNLVEKTYADTHGLLLLWEKNYYRAGSFAQALCRGDFGENKYIFLTERNNRDEIVTFRPRELEPTSGMRISYSYEKIGLDKLIREGKIIYKQGDACVLEVVK